MKSTILTTGGALQLSYWDYIENQSEMAGQLIEHSGWGAVGLNKNWDFLKVWEKDGKIREKTVSGELNKIKFHLKNLFATIWLEINAKGTL